MLLRHIWLAKGDVSRETLRRLVGYKRQVARDLRASYGAKGGPRDELAEIEANANREFARIIREAA